MPPIAVYQPKIDRLTLCYRGIGIRKHDAKRVARDLDLAFDLDLRRPVKPRWPNAGLNPWATRQDAGLAAPRHGWRVAAAHGFKPAFGHT